MPFCCQCGTPAGPANQFCGKCGARQADYIPPQSPRPDFSHGINARTAALLCYIPVVGWIAAVIVLATDRFRHDAQVRFHAFQGLYLFVAWLIVDWAVMPMFMFGAGSHGIAELLHLLIFAACIVMIIKVSQGENYRLPILGDLADRSVTEQRS